MIGCVVARSSGDSHNIACPYSGGEIGFSLSIPLCIGIKVGDAEAITENGVTTDSIKKQNRILASRRGCSGVEERKFIS